MPERKLYVKAHEDLQLGCDTLVRHRPLWLDEEVECRPVHSLPDLPQAQAQGNVVIAALQVKVPRGRVGSVRMISTRDGSLGGKCGAPGGQPAAASSEETSWCGNLSKSAKNSLLVPWMGTSGQIFRARKSVAPPPSSYHARRDACAGSRSAPSSALHGW